MGRGEILDRLRRIRAAYLVASVHSPEFRRRHLAEIEALIADLEREGMGRGEGAGGRASGGRGEG